MSPDWTVPDTRAVSFGGASELVLAGTGDSGAEADCPSNLPLQHHLAPFCGNPWSRVPTKAASVTLSLPLHWARGIFWVSSMSGVIGKEPGDILYHFPSGTPAAISLLSCPCLVLGVASVRL